VSLLATHDDPSAAADYLLCDLEGQLVQLGALPAEAVSHYRDRAADIAARLYEIAANSPREHTTCENQAPPNNGGPGGKQPSPARTRPSTKWTPKPGSTPSESSATATGGKAPSSLPASGGKAKSTPKPASLPRLKSAARKSTASSSTPGAPGHG
jgi:hypothetical protein